MLRIKLGVNLEVKWGVGSKTESKNSVLAFLKCMDGFELAFLKCMDGSVLVSLKCIDGSVLDHLSFPSDLPTLDFHSRGVPVYHSYYARKATKLPIGNRTSLLRRLQAQTLPDEAPPIGKIHPFTKMAITFEPLMGF